MSKNVNQPYDIQDYCLPGAPLNNTDYYFSNALNNEDAVLSGNASINDVDNNDVFTYPVGMDITKNLGDLLDIIQFHATYLYPKYQILQSYYEGKHHTITERDPTGNGKPDARKQINIPKRLVNAFNGYDCGNEVQISVSAGDEDNSSKASQKQADTINGMINNYLQKQQFWTMSMRLNTMASIYGRSYLYAYYDDSNPLNKTIDLIPCAPLDTIVVYDNSVAHKPMFAIRYSEDENDTFSGVLITTKGEYHFEPSNGVESVGGLKLDKKSESDETRVYPKPLACLPVIEMTENDRRIGIFCDCLSLIDSIDEIESQKVNDLLAVSNSYLVIQGVKMTPAQMQQIGSTHVINPYPNDNGIANQQQNNNQIDVKFLAPNVNDSLQENTLNRDISQIYQVAQVVDLSDPNMLKTAQTATAIRQLYQNMQAKAQIKDAEFDRVLSKLFTLLFNAWNVDPSLVDNLQFHHQLETPTNDLQEAQAYNLVNNTNLPTPIKLSFIPGHVNNNKQVAQEMDSNKSTQQSTVAKQVQAGLHNALQQSQVQNANSLSGDNNDHDDSNEESNRPAHNAR